MIVKCSLCSAYYDDAFRWTFCPHDTFLANDGQNNFKKHEDSYLSASAPKVENINEYRSRQES